MMGKNKSLTYSEQAAEIAAAALRGEGAVGRIKKAFGSDGSEGALLVTLYDSFPDSRDASEPLWAVIDSLAVPLFTASFERRGAASAVVLFDDFERADVAEVLVGKMLYADSASVSTADEDEMHDFEELIGYELTDRHSGRKGVVKAFYDYPGNPLLGVDFDGQEVLVPAVDGVIEVVSARKRRLEGDLPEGLFDL